MMYKVKDTALGTSLSVSKAVGMVEIKLNADTPQAVLADLYTKCPGLIEIVEPKPKPQPKK
jgi:hypothetical protein